VADPNGTSSAFAEEGSLVHALAATRAGRRTVRAPPGGSLDTVAPGGTGPPHCRWRHTDLGVV